MALAIAGGCGAAAAQALTPAFTYQGELRVAAGPANADFDMQFRLYNAETGGSQIGGQVTRFGVTVTNGLFAVPLDFGPAQFAGDRQWLEIAIRPAGGSAYETLSPRTEVTAAPYAWSAAVALANSVTTTSIVDGTVGRADINATQVQRRVNSACQAFEAVRAINEDGTLLCNEFGTGSVSVIETGFGLTGGPIVTSGTISVANGGIGTIQLADGGVKGVDVDPAQVQRRVLGTCAPGQYIQAIGPEGTVDCGTDATGPAGWTLSGNAGTNAATNFIGTTDAQAFTVRADNQRVARLEAIALTGPAGGHTANVLLGSPHNVITLGVRGVTISGGGVQSGNSDPDYPDDFPNQVTDHYGTVGGGSANLAGDAAGTISDRGFATVGGGLANAASGSRSTVGGGYANSASGGSSIIAGGAENTASGTQSTVGGGFDNSALALASTVGGGFGNSASSRDSVVGGGAENTASGIQSTVGGGLLNTASGIQSTVGGGVENCAGGELSWAGGSNAKVRPGSSAGADGRGCLGVPRAGFPAGDEGTFVWADSQNADFVSTGVNQFLIRANGGFGFNTNSIPTGIEAVFQGRTGPNANVDLYLKPAAHGRGINLAMLPTAGAAEFRIAQYDGTSFTDRILLDSNGDFTVTAQAFKPGGGPWAVTSDARLKSDVAPLVGTLERLLTLRGVSYTYRADSTPKSMYLPGRQIGFIAQEVEAVFPEWVTEGDDGWKTVGPRGFEALTVEALRELRAESATIDGGQDARIAALEAENAALRARLARIEALVERDADESR
jgi:hypothetical protein